MRKFATYSVLVLVAYIAGNVRHFGLDKSLAFIAPAVPYVTFAGDAVWSVIRPVGEWLVAKFATAGASPTITSLPVAAWLLLSAVFAITARAHKGTNCFGLNLVKEIWDNRPTVDGRRTLPLWLAALIPFAAVIEFGARLFYFVGFTVVTLLAAPLRILKGLLTCDLSRPLRCSAAIVVIGAVAIAAADFSPEVVASSGIRVGMKVETQNATNTALLPSEIVRIVQTQCGPLAELKFSGGGCGFRYANELRVL